MKLNNKLKLSLIAIATLTTANVNAQTYYSCIPEGCPAGQYFDGKKCIALCPEGYIVDNMKCCKNGPQTYNIYCKSKVLTSNNGVKGVLKKGHIMTGWWFDITLEKGDCVTYYLGSDSGYRTQCWSCLEP